MRDFTFYDLFAGIGGFHAAMEALGGRCVMAAEIDAAARETYEANWKVEGPFYDDIRTLTGDADALAELEYADVLCAGFPCQPFSKSGYQDGVRDRTRGTLFYEIMTIIEAKRPRFVILENVKNLAGPRHIDTWNDIVDSLRYAGYAVADHPIVASPHVIPDEPEGAKLPGGRPQVRERVFILAHRLTDDSEDSLRLDPETLGLDLAQSRTGGRAFWRLQPPPGVVPDAIWNIEDYLVDLPPEAADRYGLTADQRGWIAAWQDFVNSVTWPKRGGRADGLALTGFPVWNDSLDEPEAIEKRIEAEGPPAWKASHMRRNAALYVLNRQFITSWRERHGVAGFPASRQKFEWQAQGEKDFTKLVLQFRPSGLRVKRATYLPALVAITQTSIIGSRMRALTPVEAARLQGFNAPDEFAVHPVDMQAFRQLGNAVNVGVVVTVAEALFSTATGF